MEKELIYLWINNDDNGCFSKTEFNFNPNFNIHFDSKKNELFIEGNQAFNVFKNGNLANITAIIGNNGVGKTTLLNRIYGMPIYPVKTTKSINKEGYEEYESHQRDINYYIAAFLVNNEIIIINNYNRAITFQSNIIPVFRGTNETNVFTKTIFDGYSRVYVSFSSTKINQHSNFIAERSNEFFITPQSIVKEGFDFFQYLTSIIMKNPSAKELLPILSQNFLFENVLIAYALAFDDISSKLGTIRNEVEFKFNNLLGILHYREFEKHRHLVEYINQNWNIADRRIDENSYLFLLKANFYVELCSFGKFIFSKGRLLSDEEAWNAALRYVDSIEDIDEKNYFEKAIREIELFEKLRIRLKTNMLPSTDLAFSVSVVSDFNELKRLFDVMLDKTAPSFLLKYIQFDLHYSDGEMVFIRLYAYLFYLSHHQKFSNNAFSFLKKNVILLLDELDISLHPKIKIEFIDNLLSFVREHLSNHYVQIFLTSHSPVILSDIPVNNTVYLKREKTKLAVVYDNEKQTFGANIAKLYANSFYFDNQLPIGVFSRNFINQLYKDSHIHDASNNEIIKKKIDLIGDELIKRQFEKKSTEPHNGNISKEIVKELRAEIERLTKILKALDSNND